MIANGQVDLRDEMIARAHYAISQFLDIRGMFIDSKLCCSELFYSYGGSS